MNPPPNLSHAAGMHDPSIVAAVPDATGSLPSPTIGRLATASFCAGIFIVGYFFSVWLLEAHFSGDQEFYSNFWYAMMWAHPSEWARLQLQYLGSSEPLYRLIIGAGNYFGYDRIEYLSCWNAAMLSVIGYVLLRYRASVLFSLFVFSNYYLIVLLASAERLKFAYLFFILAFAGGGVKWKGTLSIMSVFAHTQAVVQFISAALYYFIENRVAIFASRWKMLAFAIGFPAVFGATAYFILNNAGDVISQKAEFYGSESQGLIEVVQWVLILACGLVVFDKRVQFFFGMLPMGVLTALYGNRINVATFAFFCALALAQRKTRHPFVLLVMAYMSFKTIGFIINTLNTGQGFG